MSSRRNSTSIVKKQLSTSGLRGRVNAFCVTCTFDDLQPGTWKQQIEACTVKSCPLWDVRPCSKSNSLLTTKGSSTHTLGQDESDNSPIKPKSLHTDERIVCHES